MREHPIVARVAKVARFLGDLTDRVVFVGGSVVPFLVPPVVAPTIRMTDDVDCVVQATTTVQYYALSDRLRALGFRECTDPGAPICRWMVDDICVDVMPTGESASGFGNRWYDQVSLDPVAVEVESGLEIRVVSPVTFLATKFEAFANRGHGDYMGDTDFEDIVTVLAYRDDMTALLSCSTREVQSYLSEQARILLTRVNLPELVSGCLPADPVSQEAVPEVLALLQHLAQGR